MGASGSCAPQGHGRFPAAPAVGCEQNTKISGGGVGIAKTTHGDGLSMSSPRPGPDIIQQLVSDYETGHSTIVLMQAYALGKGTVSHRSGRARAPRCAARGS